MKFANYRATANPIYKETKILKIADYVKLQNFLLVLNDVKGQLPTALCNTFKLSHNAHNYNTRGSAQFKMVVPAVKTLAYGIRSISFQAVQIWNYFMSKFQTMKLHEKSNSICKRVITEHFLESY